MLEDPGLRVKRDRLSLIKTEAIGPEGSEEPAQGLRFSDAQIIGGQEPHLRASSDGGA